MTILKKIIGFFKRLKNKKTKEISSVNLPRLNSAKKNFCDSLKIEKNKVEVIKSIGDGIGIETSIRN